MFTLSDTLLKQGPGGKFGQMTPQSGTSDNPQVQGAINWAEGNLLDAQAKRKKQWIVDPLQEGLGAAEAGFANTQAGMQPTIDQGQQAFNQQSALSGAGGAEAQAEAFANFQASPGQQFLQQRAEKALLRNAAATGSLGGGNTQSALQEQAIGFAQQDFDKQFQRLGQVAQPGQQFQQSLGGWQSALGQQQVGVGQGISDVYNPNNKQQEAPKGPSQGSQIVGAIIGGLLSDMRLKQDIQKVGELDGTDFYNWEWNQAAADAYGLTGRSFGVLAQDVEKTHPEFIINGVYKAIDTRFFDEIGIH
jgi:hypothetical protein